MGTSVMLVWRLESIGCCRSWQYVSGQPQSRAADWDGSGELVVDVKGAGAVVQSLDEDESYSLVVSASQVKLERATVVGALHGMETLLQLIECEERLVSSACCED